MKRGHPGVGETPDAHGKTPGGVMPMAFWRWSANAAAEQRIFREDAGRRDRLHTAAVARRRKAKRGGRR